MVQTEPAKEPVKPLSAEEILSRARSVDEVTKESFQVWSRQARIPAPTILGGQEDGFGTEEKDGNLSRRKYRSGSYTDIFATQLPLHYNNLVDGRVIAVRFIDHLVQNGYNYNTARPPQLDDPTFTPNKLKDTQLALLLQPKDESEKIRFERERKEIGYLLNYAGGRVEIVDEGGALEYYISGVLPQTNSVLITAPIVYQAKNQEDKIRQMEKVLRWFKSLFKDKRNQGHLYRSFLEKLSK